MLRGIALACLALLSCGPGNRATDDPEVERLVLQYWGAIHDGTGDPRAPARALLNLGKQRRDPLLRSRGLWRLSFAEVWGGSWQAGWARKLERSLALSENAGSVAELESLMIRGYIQGKWMDDLETGLDNLRSAIRLAESLELDALLARSLAYSSELYQYGNQWSAAKEAAFRSVVVSEGLTVGTERRLALNLAMHASASESGSDRMASEFARELEASGHSNLATKSLAAGTLPAEEREAWLRAELDARLESEVDSAEESARLRVLLARNLLDQDQPAEALALARVALEYFTETQNRTQQVDLKLWIAELELAVGQPVDPELVVDEVLDLTTGITSELAAGISELYSLADMGDSARHWRDIREDSLSAEAHKATALSMDSARSYWADKTHQREVDRKLEQERAASERQRAWSVLLAALGTCGFALWRLRIKNAALRRLELEVELRESVQAQLVRSQRLDSVGSFASGAAHEFNNALSVILCNSELARMSAASGDLEKTLSYLQTVEDGVSLASSSTRGLLTFVGSPRTERSAVDLNGLLLEVHSLVSRVLPASIELSLEIQGGFHAHCSGNAGELKQVLLNAVLNARDALGQGGQIKLTLGESEGEPRRAALAVRDNGSGIPEDALQQVFDPFFSTKPVGKGTGLGLTVARQIVQAHQGTLTLNSPPAGCTVLTIELPIVEAPLAALPSSRTPIIHGRGRTVLLAENHPETRATIRSQLETLGFRVVECASGKQLLEAFESGRSSSDLVLVDVDIPQIDGQACLERILDEAPGTPAVLMSALPIRRAVAGASKLHKPFAVEKLSKTLKLALAE